MGLSIGQPALEGPSGLMVLPYAIDLHVSHVVGDGTVGVEGDVNYGVEVHVWNPGAYQLGEPVDDQTERKGTHSSDVLDRRVAEGIIRSGRRPGPGERY